MLNILDFCNKNDPIKACQKPFNLYGYTVATNHYAIIFSPLRGNISENTVKDNFKENIGFCLSMCLHINPSDKLPRLLYETPAGYGCEFKGYKIANGFFNKNYIDLINDIDTRIVIEQFENKGEKISGVLFFKNKDQFGIIMPVREWAS